MPATIKRRGESIASAKARSDARRHPYPKGIHKAGKPGNTRAGGHRHMTQMKIKTCDFRLTTASANAYVPDTEPLMALRPSTATDCVQSFTNLQQGVGQSQRDGNKILLKSLRLRLRIRASAGSANTAPQHVRIIVFYDEQPNGQGYQATSAILTQTASNNVVNAGVLDDNLDANSFERIKIFRDWMITLPPSEVGALTSVVGPTGAGNDQPWQIDEFIKLDDLPCIFTATSSPGVIANSKTGSLQIMAIGDTAVGSCPWEYAGGARLRFYDV